METLIPPLSRRSQRSVHPEFGPPEPAIVSDLMEDPSDQSPQEPANDPLDEIRSRLSDLQAWKMAHEVEHSVHQNGHQLHQLEHRMGEKP